MGCFMKKIIFITALSAVFAITISLSACSNAYSDIQEDSQISTFEISDKARCVTCNSTLGQ